MTTFTNTPLVTIGVPVFNAERHLAEALDALLSQTYHNLEIIISDNASSDGTGDLCQNYARRDQRIRYVRQSKNIGILENFQFVLNEAYGKYFVWFAGDDACDPSYIEELLNFAECNKDCAVVGTDVRVVNDSGEFLVDEKLLSVRSDRSYSLWPSVQKEFFHFYTDNRYHLIYGMHRTAYAKKCSLNFGGNLRYLTSMEIPFLAQMSSFGKLASIDCPLKIYRSHLESSYHREISKSKRFYFISRYLNVWLCLFRILLTFPFSCRARLRISLYLLFSFPLYIARAAKAAMTFRPRP